MIAKPIKSIYDIKEVGTYLHPALGIVEVESILAGGLPVMNFIEPATNVRYAQAWIDKTGCWWIREVSKDGKYRPWRLEHDDA